MDKDKKPHSGIRFEAGDTGAKDGSNPPIVITEPVRDGGGGGGRGYGVHGDRRTLTLDWGTGQVTSRPPMEPSESITVTVGVRPEDPGYGRPSYPSAANISGMKLLAEQGHTTVATGFVQTGGDLTTADGQPLRVPMFTLRNPYAEKLLNGEGPKAKRYGEFAEMARFFSEDEDSDKIHWRAERRLVKAAFCKNDFEEGSVEAVLADHKDYLQWLLSAVPERFLDCVAYRILDNGSQFRDPDLQAKVLWDVTAPGISQLVTTSSAFCWIHPSERFCVYIDARLNVTYSFEFEQTSIYAGELGGRIPVGFAEDLLTFKLHYPKPTDPIID